MENVIHFIRLFQRNLKWMLALGVFTAVCVFFFTRNMPKEYQSETELFTGITSGLSIENVEGAKMDFFATNNAFDNLINIIQSRQTLQEVGMRLLAQHLLTDEPRIDAISEESFLTLQEWISTEKREKLIVEGDTQATYLNILNWFTTEPYSNEVNMLFNKGFSPYSYEAIRKVKVFRVQNSDLIRISYSWSDPAIAKETLDILNEVFIRKVAEVKVAQTNDIVAYFREQVALAEGRLGKAEESLKSFRTQNRVINYGEQTKSIAMMKEYMEDEYQKEIATRASAQAAVNILEEQLSANKEMLKYSENMLEKRQQLADINSKLAVLEVYHNDDEMLAEMQKQADEIKAELSHDLYNRMEYSRTTEGVPVGRVLEEWLEYTLALDRSNARIKVYENRKVYFNDLYDEFSVVGSTIGKMEREITIEEKNYLELLHSLNLALMRLSSETIASDGLQVTVSPFLPLNPLPSKRMLLTVLAFIVGFILPYGWAVIKDLLDMSIRSAKRFSKLTGLTSIGIVPKEKLIANNSAFSKEDITRKFSRLIWGSIESDLDKPENGPIRLNVLSMKNQEGKSYIVDLLKAELNDMGVSTLALSPGTENYVVDEDLRTALLENLTTEDITNYDVVLVEIPALLDNPYPQDVITSAHGNILTAWSGRVWSDADAKKLQEQHQLQNTAMFSLLNGGDIDELETMMGDLPKKRSWVRAYAKKVLQFQFTSSVATA